MFGMFILIFCLSGRQTQPEPAFCGLTTLVIVLNGEFDLDLTHFDKFNNMNIETSIFL